MEMTVNKILINQHSRERVNTIATFLWTWTLKLLKTDYNETLQPADLCDPLANDRSGVLGDRLEREWTSELERCRGGSRGPSLLRAILRCFWREYLLLVFLQTFNEVVLKLGIPMLIGALLHHFKDNSPGAINCALMYAGGICAATAIRTVTISQAIYGALHNAGKVRIAVCSLIYRKTLRLNLTAAGKTSTGKIINLISNDVKRFDPASTVMHYIWSAPLSIMIVGYLLYARAGYAGVLGIVALFVIAPIHFFAGELLSKFRLQTAVKTDERLRLMDEIIAGIRVIKMYAWEKSFCAMVEFTRKLELKVIRKSSLIRGIHMTLKLFTSRIAVYCVMIGMIYSGQPLSAEMIFAFSLYFDVLAYTMTAMCFRNVAAMAECIVAIRRLQQFLMYDEFQGVDNRTAGSPETKCIFQLNFPYFGDKIRECPEKEDSGLVLAADDLLKNSINSKFDTNSNEIADWIYDNTAVSLKNVTARWEQNSQQNILEDVSVNIERGKLYIVIGAVGSGKSSLISAILGEMWIADGHVDVKGRISYASQEAWMFGSTVRQNILFGQSYDHQRYRRVIKACALLSGFEQLPQGDQTIVGERGCSLSSGQKARINLARSIYRQADVYLLDDPLSTVDAHVGKHLFDECIQRYLVGKTRILTTHEMQYIKRADAILLIEHGRLTKFTNHDEFLAKHAKYTKLLASDAHVVDDSAGKKISMKRQVSTVSTISRSSDIFGDDIDIDVDEDSTEDFDDFEGTSVVVAGGSIYARYSKAGGNRCIIITVIVFLLLTQMAVVFNDLYFPVIVDAEEKRYDQYLRDIGNVSRKSDYDDYSMEPIYGYIYAYTAIVSLIFVIGLIRSFLLYNLTISASQRLHDWAFGALIRTSVRFFDTNPSGRILNRFSKDMGAIDELLPRALLDAAQTILRMFGNLTVVCIVNPVFMVPLWIIGFMFCCVRKVYLTTSKNIKRMEGALKSPVFTHMNVTLSGLSAIRAYGAQEMLKSEFDRLQDAHSSAWYTLVVSSVAFAFSLDAFCFIFTTIVTFTLLLVDGYSGSDVGLAVTTVISMTGMLQWGMRQSAEVSTQMVSVQRVLEYTLLPPEDTLRGTEPGQKSGKRSLESGVEGGSTKSGSVSKVWPSEGRIRFAHVSMKYADDESPVLKGVDFVIEPREKVGVVGRTGAGKSSLIAALFRLVEIEGVVEIDGVDTASISLEQLRRNISIIPQDPVLFSGTLRENLDPFGEFNDDELWAVLEEVEFKDAVAIDAAGLESRVLDRGANYSVGQKQLVCLARAILRNNRVLVLDEATANVDPHTDELIQKTVRTKFANCTVLTIAHRLSIIMDSNRVMVMDNGCVTEFAHPHVLLRDKSGQFTSLVRGTGCAMYDQLCEIAQRAYAEQKAISHSQT